MSRVQQVVSATLPILPILIPLGIQFVLVCFVLMSVGWLPTTYFFSHVVVIIVGLWACHDSKSVIAAIAVIVLVLFTMLLDIIQLGLYYPAAHALYGGGNNDTARTWQFSAGMCIINLLFKPLSIALGCIAVYVRAGGTLPGFGGGNAGDSYNTIHGDSGEEN